MPLWSNPRLVLAVIVSALMAVFSVTNPWAMAVMGTVRPDREMCLAVTAACMIGPVLWALTGVLFRPKSDDTADFYRRADHLRKSVKKKDFTDKAAPDQPGESAAEAGTSDPPERFSLKRP